MADLLGGVEGGGTKFLAAVAQRTSSGPPEILRRIRVETTVPEATLVPIAEWLAVEDLEGLGIATFGPLDLDAGELRATPKPGWSGTDVAGILTAEFDAAPPTGFDTDVNGAAFAEWKWGAAQGATVALYLTVGTGIGGGAVIEGAPLHGLTHPEMGHIGVPRHPDDGDFAGVCPLHRTCLEGMASGTALGRRSGSSAEQLSDDDSVWELEVYYLAHGLADLTLVLSPEVIVVGGGVMQRPQLLDRISERLDQIIGGHVVTPRLTLPHFGQEAGLIGALALAEIAAGSR